MEKKYVKILAEFDEEGRITPLELIWDDDRRFEITQIKDVRRVASTKAGGTGYRYTVTIEGQQRYLWIEDTMFNKTIGARWFIESKDA